MQKKKIKNLFVEENFIYFSEIKTYWSEQSETDNLTRILLLKQFFFSFRTFVLFSTENNTVLWNRCWEEVQLLNILLT